MNVPVARRQLLALISIMNLGATSLIAQRPA